MKTTRIKRIEKEYGMEFQDILAHYASMGESRSSTAEILGYDPSHFRRSVLHKFDPVKWPSRGKSNSVVEGNKFYWETRRKS